MKASAILTGFLAALIFQSPLRADTKVSPDVIYGRKMGMALTLDVLTPTKPNKAGVLFMVSGGWVSGWFDPASVVKRPNPFGKLLDDGFTVFLVRHGSSPVFKVPDAVEDVRKAVRFVRAHAADYRIDPNRIGVCGASAGGHLSLMLGTTGDDGNPQADDAVAKASSRVGAVVAYFPPTDLSPYLNDKRFPATHFGAELVPSVSPLQQVTVDDAPSLFVVGLKDDLVPPSHSKKMQDALRDRGVPAQFLGFPDAGHGFAGEDDDRAADALVEWFNRYLIDEDPSERASKSLEERRKNAPPTLSLIGDWNLLLTVNGDAADYTLKIDREDGVLSAKLISARSGEYPVESIRYDAGEFSMRVRRSYEGQQFDFVYDYSGTLSTEEGLRGTVAVSEDGGDRAGAGTFEAKRK
ncbi:MAG: alpha/beta hydrolase [Verrucomicrobiae bacterium]|nr:alpha/beta hydrolase [Verrucomicrobiae bacterium]